MPPTRLPWLLGAACLAGCAADDTLTRVEPRKPVESTTFDLAPAAATTVALRDDDDDDDGEVEIPLAEVPAHVRDAALAAMPGIVLEEAERELEAGIVVYDIEGELNGVEYEIEVDENGTVLEIETDDEDDD